VLFIQLSLEITPAITHTAIGQLPTGCRGRRLDQALQFRPPAGREREKQLPAAWPVELKVVETISDETAGRSKNKLKPWLKQQWCIPIVSSEFIAAIEEALDLYATPYDPKRPKVNFDESNKRLIK
jgi:hypothetical protein